MDSRSNPNRLDMCAGRHEERMTQMHLNLIHDLELENSVVGTFWKDMLCHIWILHLILGSFETYLNEN